MRLPIPTVAQRKTIIKRLDDFYDSHQDIDFEAAIAALVEWYRVPKPQVEWYEYIDRGRVGGRTFEDGVIHLQHPENWKTSKSQIKGKRQWVRMVLHEWAHYYLWCDAEKKAELFESRFLRGTRI